MLLIEALKDGQVGTHTWACLGRTTFSNYVHLEMGPKELNPMHLAPTRGEPGFQRQCWAGQGPQGPAGTIIGAAASDRETGKGSGYRGAAPDPEPLDVRRNLVPPLLSAHAWHFKEKLCVCVRGEDTESILHLNTKIAHFKIWQFKNTGICAGILGRKKFFGSLSFFRAKTFNLLVHLRNRASEGNFPHLPWTFIGPDFYTDLD